MDISPDQVKHALLYVIAFIISVPPLPLRVSIRCFARARFSGVAGTG